ncbi:MAG: hypothetical protein LBP59_05265 [Planctomycetaceae bacterium]|nr:hypothetical protein [Planctomycetaceae bacterium]
MYSTAGERGFDLKRLFVCLAANCNRDGCVLFNFLLQKKLSPLSLKNCQNLI